MERFSIKIRILVPAALALAALLGAFVFGAYRLQRHDVDEAFSAQVTAAERLFTDHLAKDADTLEAAANVLSRSERLVALWRSRDRKALLDYTLPLFHDLRSKYAITHFYFYHKDRVCFLRVHYPQRHGDRIERLTMLESAKTGQPARGIELGPLGTFTLRVVHPWIIDGELVGYLELGQEIEECSRELHNALGIDVIATVSKRYLDRGRWEAGCDDYLTKPIDRGKLLSMVAEYATEEPQAAH